MFHRRFQTHPIFLAGFGLGGRLALLSAGYEASARIKGVAVMSADVEWPFSELSPKDHITRCHAPLLLIYGEQDRSSNGQRIEEARQYVERYIKQGRQANLVMALGAPATLESKWFESLDRIVAHFETCITKATTRW